MFMSQDFGEDLGRLCRKRAYDSGFKKISSFKTADTNRIQARSGNSGGCVSNGEMCSCGLNDIESAIADERIKSIEKIE